jgi:hypothetical protein
VIYAPRHSNDRLLLGLKGSLNEYELDLLRQRSLEARYEKARRGELVVSAPVGFLRTEDQRLEVNPDQRVQERIRLVFRKFLELGSIRQALLWFLEEDLQVPAHTADGSLIWKRPRYTSIRGILTNPAYGGAYAFGRTEHGSRVESGRTRKVSRLRRREEWIALIPEHHEGFVTWEQFEQIQSTIAGNCRANQPGAPMRGAALLAGLLRCRRCGRKLTVSYTGGGRRFLRYSCARGYLDNGEPKCIGVGGIPLDEAIGREVVRVVGPAPIEAAVRASREQHQQLDLTRAALQQDLEAARYSAHRAQKQFDAADPENRLVADELERRWNQALKRVQELEVRMEQLEREHRAETSTPATVGEFADLPRLLTRVWNDPTTDARLKKRIVRTLLHEVLVDIHEQTNHIELVLHWQGGLHTELRLPRRRRGSATRTDTDIIQAVRILAKVCPDKAIAGFLNRNDLKTGRGNRWTQERITSLRQYHKIPCHEPQLKAKQGWLTLTEAAQFLHVSSRTLRIAAEEGIVPGKHPLADGPWVFRLADLQSDQAQELAHRAHDRRHTPAVPNPRQRNLGFSDT